MGNAIVQPRSGAGGRAAIYVDGPYPGSEETAAELATSGFGTVILWTLHVHENGDLFYNEDRIVSDGEYCGDGTWPAWVKSLKTRKNSKVGRVEVSIGSYGAADWENIESLVNRRSADGGTGPDSILYRNFEALRDELGVDVLNSDDESCYDVNSTVEFARMAEVIGYRNFTFVPYEEVGYWQAVMRELGSLVDRVYLQCYAGGSGNDPADWVDELGMSVDPGLWCKNGSGCADGDSPEAVKQTLEDMGKTTSIYGGFLWRYSDMRLCSAPGRTVADYAAAVNSATRAKDVSTSAATGGPGR
ncbi:lysyl endopeptidase [Saccharothrix luteola]|uniref:lysyl endopeptidase n=1 Tax=Saccharothrix luteola TaxID=2893018 RepID=UPI001E437AFF|nr:lysyl endopeptidase [Saccharothrix luteola]MCC8243099.1 lysyl endopeptidase [Saccharothrix luteola]